ncbi:Glyoxylate reductase/hydroxypyruvate reductase [Aphelenchoides bicaudatus]|nr:Glyoxylate reductase/hydroxypyruvate reductase [Aphelenchoides bicaudatus]
MASEKFKIVVTAQKVNVDKLKTIGEVVQYDGEGTMPRDLLIEHTKNADALFCLLRDKVDKELIDQCSPKLQVVGTMSVGYEHIDLDACKQRQVLYFRMIEIGYTPDVLTEATAELTVALLLSTSRRLFEANQVARNGQWKTWTPYFMCGKQLKGSVIGFYGLGKIGLSVAKKLEAFEPEAIIYNNRSKRTDVNYSFVEFGELLEKSDFLISSASSNQSNKQIFNKNAFAKMKKEAIFVNVARGTLVNTDDLLEALKTGQIYAAGLDVADPEPLPPNHPLFELPNCTLLPHIGSATYQTRNQMISVTVDNIYNALTGQQMIASLTD